jgi:hypothetical protein
MPAVPVSPEAPPAQPETPVAPCPKLPPRITEDPERYYMPHRLCPSQRRDSADGGRPR